MTMNSLRLPLFGSLIVGLVLLTAVWLYTLVNGYDFFNAIKVAFSSQPSFTIDKSEVSDRANVEVVWTGNLENMQLAEMSGYAASQYRDDVFYAINDSGGNAEIFVLSDSGKDLGTWAVNLPKPVDWEDMASYQLDNVSYLLIGDTGDNLRWRNEGFLHIIREPDGGKPPPPFNKLTVERTIKFKFPDGPRDCEGVAVDVNSGFIYLLSKRRVPAEVYRIPLDPSKNEQKNGQGIVTAERVALLTGIPQPDERDILEDPEDGEHRSLITAFDMRDGLAVVITYNHAYLFEKTESRSWAQTFSLKPQRIRLPPAKGREAGVLSRDGKFLFVSGERVEATNPVGIYRVNLGASDILWLD